MPKASSDFFLESCSTLYASVDLKVKKPSPSFDHPRGKRGVVEKFSYHSKKRLLEVCRNCGHYIKSQICLTYHFSMPENGEAVKKQLNSFLTLLRERAPGVKYVWVLEFQKRGVPHFHLFTDQEYTNKKFHLWCAFVWNRILGESKQHYAFQAHQNNFMAWQMDSGKYLAKQYLGKLDQKIVPEQYEGVGRFWGNSRNMIPLWQEIIPGKTICEWVYKVAVRIVTKRREKYLRQFNIKINYRNRQKSYTLPHCTNQFIQLLEYYQNESKCKCIQCLPMPSV